jgi:uncharacterized protein
LKLVVLDTGVVVAGLYWSNEPHRCLRAWQQGILQLVVNDAVFDEYERVVWRVKAAEGLSGDPAPFLRLVRDHALWVGSEPLGQTVCRDSNDDKFLEAALAGHAPTIVARDTDLTVLEKPFGIEIVTPRQFLARLPRQQRRRLT